MNILAKSKKDEESVVKKVKKKESVVFDSEKSSIKGERATNSSGQEKVQSVRRKKNKLNETSIIQEQEILVDESTSVLEKEEDSKQPKYQKAYFFPRFLAYVLDFVIVTMISTLVLNIVPQDKNYKVYLDEYQKIQAEFMAQDITSEEYVNKSVDVIYDLDYSNVLPMIIEVVILILYYIVFQFYNKGQTLGKKLLKIRVVSSNYEDASMNQLIFRAFVIPAIISKMVIIALVLFMGRDTYYYGSFTVQGIQAGLLIISIFMVMYSRSGRGVHDCLAKTTVIMTE